LAAENTGVLTESQVQALEAAKEEEEYRREIESYHSGYLIAQDTCYLGYIKGIGRLYQQAAIDTYSNVGFAKLYLEKTSLAASDFINDKVLLFFDQQGALTHQKSI
jgi:hypothetical protein